jgi:hypothetical protein
VPFLLLSSLFPISIFLVRRLVNWDDRHLLARGNGLWLLGPMAVVKSNFTSAIFDEEAVAFSNLEM